MENKKKNNSRIEEICEKLRKKAEGDVETCSLLDELIEIKKRRDFRIRKLRAEVWDREKMIYGMRQTIENKSAKLEKMGIPQGRWKKKKEQ